MYNRSHEVMEAFNWFDVLVTIDGETFEDAVWVTNEEEALIVANWNWEAATKIVLK